MAANVFGAGHISSNATTTLKTGQGTLHAITVNNPGTSWSATVYDSTTGSGTVIGVIGGAINNPYIYDIAFVNGLTVVTSGTTPGDMTVSFGG